MKTEARNELRTSDGESANAVWAPIGARLVSIRGSTSQIEFADLIGVSKSTLGRLERGEREIGSDLLRRLAEHGWSPTWLLMGQGERRLRGADGDEAALSHRKRSKGEILTAARQMLSWVFEMQGAVFDEARDADMLAETYEFLCAYDAPDNLVDLGKWLAARVGAGKETDDVQGASGRVGNGDSGSGGDEGR